MYGKPPQRSIGAKDAPSALGTVEEYAHSIGPCVAADDRSDVVDVDLLDAVAGLHLLGHGAGLHLAVGVADEHDLLAGFDAQLGDLVDEGLQAGLAAAHLADGDQLALVGGVHDGLDGQHGAEERGAGTESTAHLQIVQVVHGEPVVDVELVVLHPLHQLLGGKALALLLNGQIQQQALAQGGGERVHHVDVGVGELLLHVLGGDGCALVGRGKGAGEIDADDVLTGGQDGAHGVLKIPHVGGGGGGQHTASDLAVEILKADGAAVQQVGVVLAVNVDGQGHHCQLQLLGHVVGQVAAAVGHDDVIAHNDNLLGSDFSPLSYHGNRRRERAKL